MRFVRTSPACCAAIALAVCVGAALVTVRAQAPAYLDPELPVEQRVDDLVGRMTLDEKVLQMIDHAPAIPRLHVPEYNWWNEALHGVARAGLATSYPQAIGFGATWDDALVRQMATSISDEARAKHHDALRKDNHDRYFGLTISRTAFPCTTSCAVRCSSPPTASRDSAWSTWRIAG